MRAASNIIIKIIIALVLVTFGFWLLLASNMGATYLPNVIDGTLNIPIRFTMIGISVIIWIVTPLWFLWSVGRYV